MPLLWIGTPFQGNCLPILSMESDRQSPISCTLSRSSGAAPVWKAQACYPMLLQMMVRVPTLISQLPDKIQSVCLNNLPDIIPQLAVWVISANNVRVATFLRQLQTLSSHRGGTSQTSHATRHLVNGLAGVLNGIEIPFQTL